jgi:hypothetical protein
MVEQRKKAEISKKKKDGENIANVLWERNSLNNQWYAVDAFL